MFCREEDRARVRHTARFDSITKVREANSLSAAAAAAAATSYSVKRRVGSGHRALRRGGVFHLSSSSPH